MQRPRREFGLVILTCSLSAIPVGNNAPAACNDWHDVRRFHVGTGHSESTLDAGYLGPAPTGYDCMRFLPAKPIDQFPCFLGEPIYEGLARISIAREVSRIVDLFKVFSLQCSGSFNDCFDIGVQLLLELHIAFVHWPKEVIRWGGGIS